MDYYLKPMNCPMHNLIFRARRPLLPRAAAAALRVRHRLPLREVRRDPRHDPRPRIRAGRRAHLLHPEQSAGEIEHLLDFVLGAAARLRPRRLLPRAVHPRRPKPDKFVGADEDWEEATKARSRRSATESGLELVPDPGGAAYYGPKVSVQARDAIGRTWQMSTIQYDFNQPRPSGSTSQYVAVRRQRASSR